MGPDAAEALPPIDSALNHNAMIRYRTQEIGAKESNLKSQKTYWTRNFGIQADGRYGNFNNNSISVVEESSSLLASSTTQLNYGIGLYLKLPVFDVINRKNQVKKGKIELEQARSLVEVQKDEVRELVIKQYQELTLKQKLLNINSQNLGNAKVNMEMVEKEFRSSCLIASVLDLIGDKWSLLIIRDMLLFHKKTFKELMTSDEGIASNLLSSRLKLLESIELITKEKRPENKKETFIC